MGFFKTLFGSAEKDADEQAQNDRLRDFDVLKYDGIRALQMGRADYAIQCFEHALDIADDFEVRDHLSRALTRNNRLDDAFAQLSTMAEAQPDNIAVLIRMAEIAYMNEDYDTVRSICERSAMEQSDNPLPSMMAAKAERGAGNIALAIEKLDKALTLDETFGDARLLRAQYLTDCGRREEAYADADLLLQAAPENEDVLLLCARLRAADGKNDEALYYYNKVIDVDPFNTVCLQERAALRKLLGDEAGANDDLQTLAELMPEGDAGQAEDLQQKVQEAYKNNNPFGLG